MKYISCLHAAMVLVVACTLPDVHASSSEVKKSEEVVQLTPFEVTAQRIDFNRWIKIRSPHFIIYTDASQKEASLLAKHLEMTQRAAEFYFRREMRTEPPLIVLLPTEESDWRKVQARQVEWKVASVTIGDVRPLVLLEADWQESPGILLSQVGLRACSLMNIDGPRWFETGLATFFDTVTFDGDSLTVGKQGIRELPVIRYGWLPWQRFFAITSSSPEYYKDTQTVQMYFGQAAAFMHYLLTNSDPHSLQQLLAWCALMKARDQWTEADFKRIFGVDTAEMQKRIVNLMNGGRYTSGKIAFKPEALRLPIDVAPAKPAEMRELFVLSQTMLRKTAESKAAIDSMLRNGLKNEEFREVLADSCFESKRIDDALAQYRLLIANGSTNSRVYRRAGYILLGDRKTFRELDQHLGGERDEIIRWSKRAIELDPVDFDAYENLAWALAKGETVTPADVAEITRICHLLNGRTATDEALTALAIASWRSGNLKKAQQIDTLLLGSEFTRPEPREQAEALAKRLPPVSAPTAVP